MKDENTKTYTLLISSQSLHQLINSTKTLNGLIAFVFKLPIKQGILLRSRWGFKIFRSPLEQFSILAVILVKSTYFVTRLYNADSCKFNIFFNVTHKKNNNASRYFEKKHFLLANQIAYLRSFT